jgi:hypothetical protein
MIPEIDYNTVARQNNLPILIKQLPQMWVVAGVNSGYHTGVVASAFDGLEVYIKGKGSIHVDAYTIIEAQSLVRGRVITSDNWHILLMMLQTMKNQEIPYKEIA